MVVGRWSLGNGGTVFDLSDYLRPFLKLLPKIVYSHIWVEMRKHQWYCMGCMDGLLNADIFIAQAHLKADYL
jgi:hypothetical protein